MALHMINPQIFGVFTPRQVAREKAGAELTNLWQGEGQQIPINMRENPDGFARGLAIGFPGIRRLRMGFNIHSFNADGSFHPQMEAFLHAACAEGFEIHWVLMDGPSQSAGKPGMVEAWPNSYPVLHGEADWLALTQTLRDRHALAWNAMLDWLDMRPAIRTCSFEAINEPAAYDRGADAFPALRPRLMEAYVEAVLAIHRQIAARSDADLYVGGWAYSADFKALEEPLPSGGSALSRIRDGVGARLVWSAHFYPDWGPNAATVEEYEAWLDRRFAPILGDRVVMTEFNVRNADVNDPRVKDRRHRSQFMVARCARWFHRHDIGIGWWPAANYAKSSPIMIRGDGGLRQRHQNSFGAAYGFYAYGNPPDLFDRPGHVEVIRIDRAENAPTDWDDDPPVDAAKAYGLGFGGSDGVTVRGAADANNFLYGGDGHNILLGGDLDDHLASGRGGGVMRTGAGNSVVTTNGGTCRIWCGEGYALVSVFLGASTVVCDPGGHVWIFGFDPAKGDRLSFHGAFATADELAAATMREPARASLKDETNLVIALPGGGEVIVQGGGALDPAGCTLDLTDGWFAPGWQPPSDDA